MLILGSEEWVYAPGIDETFKARVDTGATTSSISALDIVPFERDGKDWVQFKIDLGDKASKEFKAPVERWAKVKQSSSDEVNKRAVVMAYIQVGDYKEKTEFTLAERGHMKFPMLLGRSFFRDIAVVDVSKNTFKTNLVRNSNNTKTEMASTCGGHFLCWFGLLRIQSGQTSRVAVRKPRYF